MQTRRAGLLLATLTAAFALRAQDADPAPAAPRAEAAQDEAASTEPQRRALLVGIGRYGGPDATRPAELQGCRNDVELVHELLTRRFGFPPENVVTLIDEKARLQTIVTTFLEHLVEPATADTEVVFYFTGHGSRIPDLARRERDDLDSSLLAYDSRTAGARGEYDLADDLLATLRLQLTARTSRVVMITDACHSAGNVRGDDTGPRRGRVKSAREPGIRPFDPKSVLSLPSWPAGVEIVDDDAQPHDGGYVHIAACEEHEQAREMTLEDGRVFGALTWYLCRRLEEARPHDTWGELARRVQIAVSQSVGHVPAFEGAVDREIFGSRFVAPRGLPCAIRTQHRLVLERGELQGIVRGSVYDVLRRNADGFELLGEARVHALSDHAASLGWEGDPPDDLEPPEIVRAELTRLGDGIEPLRIRVEAEACSESASLYHRAVGTDERADYRCFELEGELVLETHDGVRVGSFDKDSGCERLGELARQELHYRHLLRMVQRADASIEVRVVERDAAESDQHRVGLQRIGTSDTALPRWLVDVPSVPAGKDPVVTIEFRHTSETPLYFIVLSLPEERPFDASSGCGGNVGQSPLCAANVIHRPGPKPTPANEWTSVGVRLCPPLHWRGDEPMRDRFLVIATTQRPPAGTVEELNCAEKVRGPGPVRPTYRTAVAELLIPPR